MKLKNLLIIALFFIVPLNIVAMETAVVQRLKQLLKQDLIQMNEADAKTWTDKAHQSVEALLLQGKSNLAKKYQREINTKHQAYTTALSKQQFEIIRDFTDAVSDAIDQEKKQEKPNFKQFIWRLQDIKRQIKKSALDAKQRKTRTTSLNSAWSKLASAVFPDLIDAAWQLADDVMETASQIAISIKNDDTKWIADDTDHARLNSTLEEHTKRFESLFEEYKIFLESRGIFNNITEEIKSELQNTALALDITGVHLKEGWEKYEDTVSLLVMLGENKKNTMLSQNK